MAPAKKQKGKGAQPAAAGPPRKLSKADRSALYRKKQAAAVADVQAQIDKPKFIGAPVFPYTEELGLRIHDLVADGKSLSKIAAIEGMPARVTMLKWLGDEKHSFALLYAQAKQLLVAAFEDEIQEIADTQEVGEIVTERDAIVDGAVVTLREVRRTDMLEHRKLKIDARRWTLAHLRPKKHGKLADGSGEGKNEQLEALFQSLKSGPVE
jgi:hypothetical protein